MRYIAGLCQHTGSSASDRIDSGEWGSPTDLQVGRGISVPRNIDPEVNKIDNVFLYDIDDLQGVIDSNVQGRQQEAEKAEDIIAAEVGTYLQWERALDAVPTIVDLRDKVEEVRFLIWCLFLRF